MADNMDEDLKKMKVPDLRQALKDKGLPTSGTKPELIKRLLGSVGSPVDGGDSALDEDEILKDDPAPPAAAGPAESPEKLPTKASNETNGEQKSTGPSAEIQMPADTTNVAKPVEVQKLTEAERLKVRAEKFGITSEQAKKDLRAQRFGLSENKSGNISSSNIPVDPEKLKKRAERFGLPATSQTSEEERKRKRAERFGTSTSTPAKSTISVNSTDSELEAKKKKRAERFGLT